MDQELVCKIKGINHELINKEIQQTSMYLTGLQVFKN